MEKGIIIIVYQIEWVEFWYRMENKGVIEYEIEMGSLGTRRNGIIGYQIENGSLSYGWKGIDTRS